MKSPSDPIRSLTLQIGTIVAIGVVALGVIAWRVASDTGATLPFAWAPVRPDLPKQDIPPPLDLALFERQLAPDIPVPETIPTERVPEPTPPPPLRIAYSLVGLIVSADGDLSAVIYDQDLDQLLTATRGDSLGRFTVTAITKEGVALTLGDRLARLDLDPVEEER